MSTSKAVASSKSRVIPVILHAGAALFSMVTRDVISSQNNTVYRVQIDTSSYIENLLTNQTSPSTGSSLNINGTYLSANGSFVGAYYYPRNDSTFTPLDFVFIPTASSNSTYDLRVRTTPTYFSPDNVTTSENASVSSNHSLVSNITETHSQDTQQVGLSGSSIVALIELFNMQNLKTADSRLGGWIVTPPFSEALVKNQVRRLDYADDGGRWIWFSGGSTGQGKLLRYDAKSPIIQDYIGVKLNLIPADL